MCGQIPNHQHECAVFITKTQKLAYTSHLIKLWNLVAILKFGVQNKDRAPPHTCFQQIMVVALGLREDFQRRHPTKIFVRKMVAKPCHVSHYKSPQPSVIGAIIWPVECGMRHHRPSPIADGLDGPLSLCILMLCSNTREGLGRLF